jgi:hypothetical protein
MKSYAYGSMVRSPKNVSGTTMSSPMMDRKDKMGMTSGMAMMYGGKAKPRKKLATGAEVRDTKAGKPNIDAMFRKIYKEFVGRSPSAAVLNDFRSKFQNERVTKQDIENFIDAGKNPNFRGQLLAKPPAD